MPAPVTCPCAASSAEISRRESFPPFGDLRFSFCASSTVAGFISAMDLRPSTFTLTSHSLQARASEVKCLNSNRHSCGKLRLRISRVPGIRSSPMETVCRRECSNGGSINARRVSVHVSAWDGNSLRVSPPLSPSIDKGQGDGVHHSPGRSARGCVAETLNGRLSILKPFHCFVRLFHEALSFCKCSSV